MTIEEDFIQQSIYRINENTVKIEKCLELLSEKDIWQKPSEQLNSVGNLIVHLNGNITQYILATLGGEKDKRQRDAEFSSQGGLPKSELLSGLKSTIEKSIGVIREQTSDSLMKKRNVQAYSFSGIGIILHVVEHYSYHTGQIVLWTRLLKNVDMGFYSGIDLNKKHD